MIMVFETEFKNKKVFACSECGFVYVDKSTAEKCEAYCKKFGACSLEITKNAVGTV